MVALDDLSRYASIDRQDALADLEQTADQWAHAALLADVRLDLSDVEAVVIAGMGGSGITGDVVAAVAAQNLPVPIHVVKGYRLPAFVGPSTLVVAASYSGNTEETLHCVADAERVGAQVFAVTSGGALGDICDAAGYPYVRVPGGRQPRHSLGYLAVPVLRALGLDDGLEEAIAAQRELAGRWSREVPLEANKAKRLGERIAAAGGTLVLGGEGLAAIAAYRLKCQLNENAKLPAVALPLPEAHHNEVVSWQEIDRPAMGLVVVREPAGEHPRMTRRYDVTVSLAEDRFPWIEQLVSDREGQLVRLASLLLLLDLTSVYAALALDRDPTPIPFIARLKQDLAAA